MFCTTNYYELTYCTNTVCHCPLSRHYSGWVDKLDETHLKTATTKTTTVDNYVSADARVYLKEIKGETNFYILVSRYHRLHSGIKVHLRPNTF